MKPKFFENCMLLNIRVPYNIFVFRFNFNVEFEGYIVAMQLSSITELIVQPTRWKGSRIRGIRINLVLILII